MAFELASLIQHDAKIGSDPVLLGELTDLLSHELDKPEEDPKLTQYLALDAGRFPDARGEDRERAERRSARAAGARASIPDMTTPIRHRGRRQPGEAGGPAGRQARRRQRGQGPGRGGRERRARSAPDGRLCAWGSLAASRPREFLRERIQQDEDRFVRYNAAVALARRGDPAAEGTLREMLSTADLARSSICRATREKQNKIEAIELEALEALRDLASAGQTGARQGRFDLRSPS